MKPIILVFVATLAFGQSLDASAQRSPRAHFNKALSFARKIDNDISKNRVIIEKVLFSKEREDIVLDSDRDVTMWITSNGAKVKDGATFGASGYDITEYYLNKKARFAILIKESKHLSRKCFIFDDLEQPIICAVATWREEEFAFSGYDVHWITFQERQEAIELLNSFYEVMSMPQDEKIIREFMGQRNRAF